MSLQPALALLAVAAAAAYFGRGLVLALRDRGCSTPNGCTGCPKGSGCTLTRLEALNHGYPLGVRGVGTSRAVTTEKINP